MMIKKRIIWQYELKLAKRAAKELFKEQKPTKGWNLLVFPLYLVQYLRYKSTLRSVCNNFLFTKKLALEAAVQVIGGQTEATQMRIIETRTRMLLQGRTRPYYTQAIRRKQLIEIELLIRHYVALLKSSATSYGAMIRDVYPDRNSYTSFLKRLQQVEREVLAASATTLKKSSKKKRIEWFGKIEQTFKALREKEATAIYS